VIVVSSAVIRGSANGDNLCFDKADKSNGRPLLMEDGNAYGIGFAITAVITFIVSWIYCIATYGFLLGVGLGWLPSLIVAVIAGVLWPLILLAIIIILFVIFKN
jgi:hypothetical protein